MAVPPKSHSIEVDTDADQATQMQQLLSQLGDFMLATKTALEGGLTKENIQLQVATVTINPGQAYPITVTNQLPARPRKITVAQVQTLKGPAPTGGVAANQFRMKDANTIEILAVSGLASTGTYTLTLDIE